MNITQAIKMSAKSIFSNKARSALTMLGIIIGLAPPPFVSWARVLEPNLMGGALLTVPVGEKPTT